MAKGIYPLLADYKIDVMKRERIIRAITGIMILLSVSLAVYVNINWLFLTAFVGLNLFQSAITKWCLMDDILRKVFKIED